MKNVIKKIASVAMALTLLGTGSAVTKTVTPQTDNTITASAASCNHRTPYAVYGNWQTTWKEYLDYKFNWWALQTQYKYCYHQKRTVEMRCVNCDYVFSTSYETRDLIVWEFV